MKSRIWMVALLIIVGCLSAGLLGVLNTYTAPIVARNKEIKLKTTVLDVFGIPYTEENMDAVFETGVSSKTKDDTVYYESYGKDKELTAIAFEIGGPGFGSPISVILALEPDLETVKGLKVLSQTETPGLGERIVEPVFQSQFSGKKIKPFLAIVPYRKAVGINEVDAVTGATATSRALEKIINTKSRSFLEKLNKG